MHTLLVSFIVLAGVCLAVAAPLAPERFPQQASRSRQDHFPRRNYGNAGEEDDLYYGAGTEQPLSRTTLGKDGCRTYQMNGMNCRECISNKGGVYEREERCTREDKILESSVNSQTGNSVRDYDSPTA